MLHIDFHKEDFVVDDSKLTLVSYPGPKYKKVSFSNSGHAFNLAERLNKLYKTDKFEVIKLTQGEVIKEDDTGLL